MSGPEYLPCDTQVRTAAPLGANHTGPDRRAAAAPHASAVADGSIDLSNSEFLAAVRRAAATLRTAGASTGDVVAVMLPDTATLVVSMFAAWRPSATVTLVDPLATTTDIRSRQVDADAKVLIAAQPSAFAPSTQAVVPADELTAAGPDIIATQPSDSSRSRWYIATICGMTRSRYANSLVVIASATVI